MASKRYDQFCGVARALEVVGERWTLLIVRELLTGPKRFSQLRAGLGSVAPTVLTERLRSLTADGIVELGELPPPAGVSVYSLTPRGEELRDVVLALGRWGTPLLAEHRSGDTFSARWLLVALWDRFRPVSGARDVTFEFRIGKEILHASFIAGELTIAEGPAQDADHVIEAPPVVFARWGIGHLDTDDAIGRGLKLSGGHQTIAALQEIFGPVSET